MDKTKIDFDVKAINGSRNMKRNSEIIPFLINHVFSLMD